MMLQSRVSSFCLIAMASALFLVGCGSPSVQPANSARTAQTRAAETSNASRYGSVTVPLRPEQLNSDDSPQNADANFQGCWYKTGKVRFQAVDVQVKNPGTYPFNAKLYYGTTCDPNTQADQFGFGQEIYFGGFGYIFWFDAFGNKTDMSALWYVGTDVSKCVSYKTAPMCP